jgi:hypothetical protein
LATVAKPKRNPKTGGKHPAAGAGVAVGQAKYYKINTRTRGKPLTPVTEYTANQFQVPPPPPMASPPLATVEDVPPSVAGNAFDGMAEKYDFAPFVVSS